jgi:uncharacterized coiled-coil DUF342 family protein
MELENKNSNKIARIEERIVHLVTKEDMQKSHEDIKDMIQNLANSIDKLVNEFGVMTKKSDELMKVADSADKRAQVAYAKSLENHDGIKKQGERIDKLIQRLDFHIKGHKEMVMQDIELSIFKSSKIRKIFFLALFIGAYLFTIQEFRNVLLGIIFKPFQ